LFRLRSSRNETSPQRAGRPIRAALIVGLGTVVALAACTATDGNDAGSDGAAATDATAAAATIADDGGGAEAPADTTAAGEGGAPAGTVAPEPLALGDPLAGRDIAVEATATVETDDVAAAVDGITASVTARGGFVASAAIDYAPDVELGPDAGPRASIVAKVPPSSLGRIVTQLRSFGTVTGFDQLAEDVTEQLADLDVRIANQRASVARLRELVRTATDIEAVVRLEAALTERETELERLLAAQRNLDDRVAMSTLTVDVVASEEARRIGASTEVDDPRPGAVDALQRGWDAFLGVLFTLVLVLAAGAPFIVLALALLLAWLVARRALRRPPARAIGSALSEEADSVKEPASANRPG
jgi:hypothetical protein